MQISIERIFKKKKAYDCFYFVSNKALLDIFSNAENQEKVDEYTGGWKKQT
jgi:hypothetical protein